MTRGQQQLDTLAQFLERHGDDPQRLDLVRRAQSFKRSWIELAEGLAHVRATQAYRGWGYDDFHRYCQGELHLKAPTVDKLLVSYSTLKSHAPEVLERDGVVRALPSVQAIDYFSRAIDRSANDPHTRERQAEHPQLLDDLRTAVFEQGSPVTELRKRFDPILRPVNESAQQLQHIDQALRALRKLVETLPLIDGVTMQRRQRTEASLDLLREDLDQLRAPLVQRDEPEQAAG